jgi:hypothetical protein
VFRDLTKPIGALNPTRVNDVIARYTSFEDDVIPPFHYGSHYSSSGTVLFYLIRLEPFTRAAVSLQDGHFDNTDRMFHSLEKTWDGVFTNPADVKELIPEMFYCPEMFLNTNRFDFGLDQKGKRMDDCILPSWCNGNPAEFIRLHREALESEYVSTHLHSWIDLIFGCKQRGKEAEDAVNVFFYLTYQGAVDPDTMSEAEKRQVENFGQTPAQLTTRPHPPRMTLKSLATTTVFSRIRGTKNLPLCSNLYIWLVFLFFFRGDSKFSSMIVYAALHRSSYRLVVERKFDGIAPLWLQVPPRTNRDFSLSFRVSTRDTQAMLLALSASNLPSTSKLVLFLIQSKLYVIFSSGDESTAMGSDVVFNDGSLHPIIIVVDGTRVRVFVGGDIVIERNIRVGAFDIDPEASITIADRWDHPTLKPMEGKIMDLTWHDKVFSLNFIPIPIPRFQLIKC